MLLCTFHLTACRFQPSNAEDRADIIHFRLPHGLLEDGQAGTGSMRFLISCGDDLSVKQVIPKERAALPVAKNKPFMLKPYGFSCEKSTVRFCVAILEFGFQVDASF
jgi:hypothetical protein